MTLQVERKDLAWERWYDLSSQEIGEMIKAPKCDPTVFHYSFLWHCSSMCAHRVINRT